MHEDTIVLTKLQINVYPCVLSNVHRSGFFFTLVDLLNGGEDGFEVDFGDGK